MTKCRPYRVMPGDLVQTSTSGLAIALCAGDNHNDRVDMFCPNSDNGVILWAYADSLIVYAEASDE